MKCDQKKFSKTYAKSNGMYKCSKYKNVSLNNFFLKNHKIYNRLIIDFCKNSYAHFLQKKKKCLQMNFDFIFKKPIIVLITYPNYCVEVVFER